MRPNNKKPLYRKVNTKARGVHHLHGGDYKNSRNRESGVGMRKGIQRGLDYTPLFKFLLSKVGYPWNEIHSEAVSRLDKEEPIYWLVAKDYESANELIRIGESSYFSGLYVDGDGILRVVNPDIDENTLEPLCKCCTHTFNGVLFTRKYGE
ncbi:hypothetical protein EZI54_04420 [Marinobacter halodurans]|uniref:Uncharacterized protein n=1 Tax=Marinobacter halodurans TaxID=2528979 RepID=A0ABY1ZNJ8_9GAMM|nr:hypothetical protein [Marinobacter halodurans]TBW58107.1 hypothetical protein EZI54_04420 [Marinobacter halodurans]